MTAPKPDDLKAELKRISHQLLVLDKEYRWAHDLAHAGDRRGRSERGGHYTGDPNDPTGTVVASRQKQKARKACEHASKAVGEAVEILRSAIYDCGQAMKDTHEPAAEPIGMTSLVTRAERGLSEEARDRRVERGEDVPA